MTNTGALQVIKQPEPPPPIFIDIFPGWMTNPSWAQGLGLGSRPANGLRSSGRSSIFSTFVKMFHSPFAVGELGYAVVPSARGVGAFHRRLGGDLCSHGLHQALQLGSCGGEEALVILTNTIQSFNPATTRQPINTALLMRLNPLEKNWRAQRPGSPRVASRSIISCVVDPLWWIKGETVAVDMAAAERNQIASQRSVNSMT